MSCKGGREASAQNCFLYVEKPKEFSIDGKNQIDFPFAQFSPMNPFAALYVNSSKNVVSSDLPSNRQSWSFFDCIVSSEVEDGGLEKNALLLTRCQKYMDVACETLIRTPLWRRNDVS